MPWKRVVSKGPYRNHVHNDHEAAICRDDKSVKQFKPGDIAWIKIRGCCWWPGQVVDEGSAGLRPKKRVKIGVLVRMYGCYEFLYVDPVKSSNEFENMLKEENLSIKDAFQKALDEELSCVRSGGKSNEQVTESRDIATMDASNGRKQRQDETERINTDESPPSPGISSGEVEEASALEKKNDDSKVKATTGKKFKQDGTRNMLVYTRTRHRASEVLSTKEGAREPNVKEKPGGKSEVVATGSKRLVRDKGTNLQVYARTRSRASKGQSTEQEVAREPNIEEKSGPGVPKVRETPKLASNITKQKDIKEKIEGKQKLAAEASKGDSKIKDMTEGPAQQLKPNDDREGRTDKAQDDARREKTKKTRCTGKGKCDRDGKSWYSKRRKLETEGCHGDHPNDEPWQYKDQCTRRTHSKSQ